MESCSSRGPARFVTQANALLLKNFSLQKRNVKTNVAITAFPILLCLLLVSIQNVINHELDKPKYQCGCACVSTGSGGKGCKNKLCGIQYSTHRQAASCAVRRPPRWPALVQVPDSQSCMASESCPVVVLVTGRNRKLSKGLAGRLFPAISASLNVSDYLDTLSSVVPGSGSPPPPFTQFIEPAFAPGETLYFVQPRCQLNSSQAFSGNADGIPLELDVRCVQGLPVWRKSSWAVNHELFKGYRHGNARRRANQFVAAYDFLDTSDNRFRVIVWYNSTYNKDNGQRCIALLRVARSVNMASTAYLKFLRGSNVEMRLEYVKEMPKTGGKFRLDYTSLLDALFFTWTIQLLFPVLLTYLVYEKQQNLRIMMKMHGLKDGPYWLISYAYFFSLSAAYMMFFVIFGSLIGLDIFRLNGYSIQCVFYFVYINLQIVLAFLLASFFSSVKTANVIGYMYVFGSSLLGASLLRLFIEDTSYPKHWIVIMETVPGFSLYRGIYEFSQYAFAGSRMGVSGMQWGDLNDQINGMKDVLVIMAVEWALLLPVAFYLDHISASGGRNKDPLSFFRFLWKKRSNLAQQGSKIFVDLEKPDVSLESKVVAQLLVETDTSEMIICNNLKKVYSGRNGNPDKYAVRGLSLALRKGQCFGMLGPNGAGKTSFINMMIGLVAPSSGTAYIRGMDIRTDMNEIYTSMGVCPQHDLLWETLTGREHLLFYGRMKNFTGASLMQAVEESLKSVNLFGVGDKSVSKYSGGMKRRLSVAISLIGNPKVVYMDEPSTGLDAASRNDLWNVLKHAKKNRTIVLTTHSMEEADVLCDRLGIFVDGNFHCLGSPRELKARYGGNYMFTMTTFSEHEEEIECLVCQLFPGASKMYSMQGTQKFELPKREVKIAGIFRTVEAMKSMFPVHAWGLVDTTLEDVFIRVAKEAQALDVLS